MPIVSLNGLNGLKGRMTLAPKLGGGYTFDLPTGVERTDIAMLFVFPNWQYNLTGLIGESWYQGALFHHVEAGFASCLKMGIWVKPQIQKRCMAMGFFSPHGAI